MKLKSFKGYCLISSMVVLFLCGCATGPRASGGLPYPVVTIDHMPYYALLEMCEKEHLSWDYDALSKVIVLKKEDKVYRLLVDSGRFMLGAGIFQLPAPVKIDNGVIYVPADFSKYVREPCGLSAGKELPCAPVFLRQINSIVLDAGHGGRDPGAIGRGGLREKDVVLDVAGRLSKILESAGLKVYMTRAQDMFIPLPERSRIANEDKADLFISIHANANRSRWIEGFEVYYLTEGVDDDARALAAGEDTPLAAGGESLGSGAAYLKATLWDLAYTENRKESIELADDICEAVSNDLKLRMLGVRGAPFAVLKGAQMPAVLVEIGYISNREGEKKLRSSSYRQKMAESIARGILGFKDYAQGRKSGSQQTAENKNEEK